MSKQSRGVMSLHAIRLAIARDSDDADCPEVKLADDVWRLADDQHIDTPIGHVCAACDCWRCRRIMLAESIRERLR